MLVNTLNLVKIKAGVSFRQSKYYSVRFYSYLLSNKTPISIMTDPSAIFNFGNTFVLVGWLLLVFIPYWKYTQAIIMSGIIIILSIIYSFMILKDIGNFNPDSFGSLINVKALFQNDSAVAAGWLHYLAFDLFVGAYIMRKAKELGISRIFATICLPFTFMFGPMGYLLFFVIKTIKTKTVL